MASPNTPTHDDLSLERTELILKRKIDLLETALEQNVRTKLPRAERCLILQRKIDLLEREIAVTDISSQSHATEAPNALKSPSPSQLHHVIRSTSPKRTWMESTSMPIVMTSPSPPSSPPQLVDTRMAKRIKLIEEKPPCLRCKILKKKCDDLQDCAHCPLQSFDNESDYWKVLGCLRGELRQLASAFVPDFATTPSRVLRCRSGALLKVDSVLVKSRVSQGKYQRILNLFRTRGDFADLTDSVWEDVHSRLNLSRQAINPHIPPDEVAGNHMSCEDYEAPWALLQAVSMDFKYCGETEYNSFRLLRMGNSLSGDAHASWDIFRKSKNLLRQSVEVYLFERLCGTITSGELVGPLPFEQSKLPASNSLIQVNIKPEIEDFLDNFERICSGRSKLTGHAQMACFYSLLLFSISKSLLIDAYSTRTTCDDINPWNETFALRITSAFKALVGVFSWSSKSDVMLQSGPDIMKSGINWALTTSREMVKIESWKSRGFKSSKDFLLGLGSFKLPNGAYNGFFIQKFGFESVPQLPAVSSTLTHELGLGRNREAPLDPDTLNSISSPSKSTLTPSRGFRTLKFAPTLAGQNLEPESPETLAADSDSQEYGRLSRSRRGSLVELSIHPASSSPRPGSADALTFISHDSNSQPNAQFDRRRGPLDAETLKKVREIRKIGACWNCWVLKVPCSEGQAGQLCERCRRSTMSQVCSRAAFASHANLFFPEFYNSRFTTEFTGLYIHDNVHQFSVEKFAIEISWTGQEYISLPATRFIATPRASTLDKYQSHRTGLPLNVESLPLGLVEGDMPEAQKACLQSFEKQLNDLSYPEIFPKDQNPRSNLVLKFVHEFHRSMQTKHPLLHDALLFYLMINNMRQPIMISRSSASTVVSQLKLNLQPQTEFSSRMLDRQVKHLIYLENHKILSRLLRQLEKMIRRRQRSSWPILFSTILVLCLSIEQIQDQVEFYIATVTSELGTPDHLMDEPQKTCQSLENLPFAQFSHLFHTIYRTTQGEKAGINPFRSNTSSNEFDGPARVMTRNFQMLLNDLKSPNHFEGPFVGQAFRRPRHAGRLITKFLLPFVESKST